MLVAVLLLFNGIVIHDGVIKAEAVTITESVKEKLVSRIVEAAENLEDSVNIADLNISKYYDFDDVFYKLLEDNPGLFYLSSNYYASYKNNKFTYFGLNFTNEIDEIREMKKKFNDVTQKVLNEVDKAWPDVMKALYLHDYIVLNAEYDLSYDEWNTDYDDMCYTAYGILVEKCGVCQGYAYAYKYLLDLFGIENELAISDEMNHVWNLVKIDGSYYHVDVTFDDTEYNNIGRSKHNNFMLSDKKIISASGTMHTGWRTVSDITASSTKYDSYFWRDVESAFLPINGSWYFVDKNGDINSYDFYTNKSSVMMNTNVSWLKWGSSSQYLNNKYVRIVALGDAIIYNTDREIYMTDTSFGYCEKIYEADVSSGYIYGIAIEDNRLVYCLKTRLGEYEKKYITDITADTVRQPSKTPDITSPGENIDTGGVIPKAKTYNYYNTDGEIILSTVAYNIGNTTAPLMEDINGERFLRWEIIENGEDIVDLYPCYGVIGDADNDGILSLIDVYYIFNYTNGYYELDSETKILCDVDNNSVINIIDCEMLLRYFTLM